MQTNTMDSSETRLQKLYRLFKSQPHQPFFVLGIFQVVYAILTLLILLIIPVNIDIRLFHVVNIAYMMPINFFLGFLLTVLPRFLSQVPYLLEEYMPIFWLSLMAFLSVSIGFFMFDALLIAGLTVMLLMLLRAMALFVNTYKKSHSDDKFDPFWIIALFSTSIVATVLFVVCVVDSSFVSLATNTSFFLFAICTVFFIAQKMLPVFYGFYFNNEPIARQKSVTLLIILSLFLIVIGKMLDSRYLLLFANISGFILSFWLFVKNGVLFKLSKPILFILQVGILWFVFGFLVGAFEQIFLFSSHAQIHVFGLGFLGTMVVGFGTRVTLGHSEQKIEADKLTVAIFIAYQILVLLRLYAVFDGSLIIASGLMWTVVFCTWLYRYLPDLLRIKSIT